MKRAAFSFDPMCMDLARHFYPSCTELQLLSLAQQFQDAAEGFIDQSGSAGNDAATAVGAESTAALANEQGAQS